MVLIRDAVPADAPAACEVMRRSITELCTADHHNDLAILDRWVGNKTPEIVAGWIARPGNSMLVAVEGAAILAVGAVEDGGCIRLNYVSPDARFRGVSRALPAALEARAAKRGSRRCTLDSTGIARRFYLSAGYVTFRPVRRSICSAPSAIRWQNRCRQSNYGGDRGDRCCSSIPSAISGLLGQCPRR